MAAITIGSSSYEVYDTVANCNAYLNAKLSTSPWDGTGTDDDMRAMVMATRILERLRWQGAKTVSSQLLEFPRDGLVDKDGLTVTDGTTPQEILDGFCELTLAIRKDPSLYDRLISGAPPLRSASAGSVSVEWSGAATTNGVLPDAAQALVYPFLNRGLSSLKPRVFGTDQVSVFSDDPDTDDEPYQISEPLT